MSKDIDHQIARRNLFRAEVGLPPLDSRETERLQTAQDLRVLEAVFARERSRFEHQWTGNRQGFLANWGRWSAARQQVQSELRMGRHVEHVLTQLGYRLVDDRSDTLEIYVNAEAADESLLAELEKTLANYGWKKGRRGIYSFSNDQGDLIEITSEQPGPHGHVLKHLKH
jgi:hypothetical protein